MEYKISRILIILTLIVICSSVAIVATSNYPSSYAQTTGPVITKIMPSRMNTPINASLTNLKTVAANVALTPMIKILSPYNGQKVPVTDDDLIVSGTSSYDRSKDCSVSVNLNGIKPYQKTISTGNDGARDYSTWKYKLDPSYTTIREGSNKLTAKVTCLGSPNSLTKWTSVGLIGTRDGNGNATTATATPHAAQPMPLRISISVDKNPIIAGDTQAITVKVHSPGITNSSISGAKVNGRIIDLSFLSSSPSLSSSSSSFPHKNMNAVVEQFDNDTDKNGEVSYSWKVPANTPIGTPYIVKVDAFSDKYSGRSESNIFIVKPSNNDNPFILAQASRNFTNGLNDNIKNFTQDIFNKVRNSLENNLR